ERVRTRHHAGLPAPSAVQRTDPGPADPGCPDDVRAHDAQRLEPVAGAAQLLDQPGRGGLLRLGGRTFRRRRRLAAVADHEHEGDDSGEGEPTPECSRARWSVSTRTTRRVTGGVMRRVSGGATQRVPGETTRRRTPGDFPGVRWRDPIAG